MALSSLIRINPCITHNLPDDQASLLKTHIICLALSRALIRKLVGAAGSITPIFHPYLEWKSWRRAAKLSGLPSRCFSNKLAKIPFVREKGGRRRKGSRIRRSTWLKKPGSERGTTMRLALNNAKRVHSRTTACLRTFDSESTFVNSLSFVYFVSCSKTQLKRRRIAELMKFFINHSFFGSPALRDPNI